MAMPMTELERLQQKVAVLEKRLTKLEKKNGKSKGVKRNGRARTTKSPLNERERAREILRRAGMLAELTPEEKARAAEWRALPKIEKQRTFQKLYSLRLDPPLSETILQDRE